MMWFTSNEGKSLKTHNSSATWTITPASSSTTEDNSLELYLPTERLASIVIRLRDMSSSTSPWSAGSEEHIEEMHLILETDTHLVHVVWPVYLDEDDSVTTAKHATKVCFGYNANYWFEWNEGCIPVDLQERWKYLPTEIFVPTQIPLPLPEPVRLLNVRIQVDLVVSLPMVVDISWTLPC